MSVSAEAQLRKQLARWERHTRRQALLALAAWHRTGIVSERLFPSIAALQRPTWGRWNGLLSSLAKARRKVLQRGEPQEREALQGQPSLALLLDAHERVPAELERDALEPLSVLLGSQLPGSLRRDQVLGMAISLRNRVAHDQPTDPDWWRQAAEAFSPIDSILELPLPEEAPEPWFLEADGCHWSFNGLRQDFVALYVDSSGNSRYDPDLGERVVAAMQHLLGEDQVQAADLKHLLGKLAPKDLRGVLMDDFLVGAPVGSGRFSTVHEGRQLSTGRKVAIKLLDPGLPESRRERFLQEASVLGRFQHPHIVEVLGRGQDVWRAPRSHSLEGETWFAEFKRAGRLRTWTALEWVDGVTLEKCPEDATEDQILDWFAQAAGALQAVHDQGVFHRNVKPANLMIHRAGHLMLMDFGIARSQEESAEERANEAGVGSPAYMAPEQLRLSAAAAEIGPRADIYGLCATFYELLTDTRIFDHDRNASELVSRRKLEGKRPSRPRRARRLLSWQLETVLMGGLEPQRLERYASADALKQDVERVREFQPIQYRPPGPLRRTLLAYRRNPLLTKVVIGFLVLLSSVVIWAVQNLTAERNRTEAQYQAALIAKNEAQRALKRSKGSLGLSAAKSATGDPTLSLLLLSEAKQEWGLPNWMEVASEALQRPIAQQRFLQTGMSPAVWSPDGRKLAYVADNSLWIHSLGSNKPPREIKGYRGTISQLEWSPNGASIAMGSVEGVLYLWLFQGSMELITLSEHQTKITDIHWHPESTRLVTASEDHTARIWTLNSEPRSWTLIGHQDIVNSARWNPDGSQILTTSADGTARIWDAEESRHPILVGKHSSIVWNADWSPSGRQFATASDDHNVRLWDAKTGALTRLFRGHTKGVWAVKWSPLGDRLATASMDGTLRVWSLKKPSQTIVLEGHEEWVGDVQWNAAGTALLSASLDGTAILWNPAESPPLKLRFEGHKGGVVGANWSSSGQSILTSSEDGGVRVWTLPKDSLQPGAYVQHTDIVLQLRWHPNGTRLITASADGHVGLWQVAHGLLPSMFPVHRDWVWAAAQNPISGEIASISLGGQMFWWTAKGSTPSRRQSYPAEDTLSVDWSPDGRQLAQANIRGDFRLWDIKATSPPPWRQGHKAAIHSIRWSPDGAHLLTASEDHTVRIWHRDGRRYTAQLEHHTGPVIRGEWSPDGNWIGTASEDGTAQVYSLTHRGPPIILDPRAGIVSGLSWSPDSQRVVTSTKNGQVQVWELSDPKDAVRIRHTPGETIRDVAWHPNGKHLAIAAQDKIHIQVAPPRPLDCAILGTTKTKRCGLDKALWLATKSCLRAAERQQYLAELADEAQANERRCRQDKGTLPLAPTAGPTSP